VKDAVAHRHQPAPEEACPQHIVELMATGLQVAFEVQWVQHVGVVPVRLSVVEHPRRPSPCIISRDKREAPRKSESFEMPPVGAVLIPKLWTCGDHVVQDVEEVAHPCERVWEGVLRSVVFIGAPHCSAWPGQRSREQEGVSEAALVSDKSDERRFRYECGQTAHFQTTPRRIAARSPSAQRLYQQPC
jgi:hypothetical protein